MILIFRVHVIQWMSVFFNNKVYAYSVSFREFEDWSMKEWQSKLASIQQYMVHISPLAQ